MNTATFTPARTPIAPSKYAREYELGRVGIIREKIGAGQGRHALDLGCGPGAFTRILSENGWHVTAVDTDPGNLAHAQPFAASLREGDVLSVLATTPAASFDLVLTLELIEHMPEEQGRDLLRHVKRVLRPGGTLLLSTPNRWSVEGLGGYYWGERIRRWQRWDAWDSTHVRIYSSREILRAMRTAGFDVESVTGYWYRGHVPLLGRWTLPLSVSRRWPMNRLGFNVIVSARG